MKGRVMVFAYFNYATELYQLLELIAGKTTARLQVLFQHPSPSLVTRNSISCAGRDCAKAMLGGIISRVDFVFDFHPSKNSWNGQSLLDTFLASCDDQDIKNKLFVSELTSIAEINCNGVDHPVFGDITRLGWAKMKKGTEQWVYIKLF